MTNWAKIRDQLFERCSGYCEKCGQPLGQTWASHHRKLRSQGGKDELANLVALHHFCHNTGRNSVHMQPRASYANGLMVRSHDNPGIVPLRLLDGTMVLLGDSYQQYTED